MPTNHLHVRTALRARPDQPGDARSPSRTFWGREPPGLRPPRAHGARRARGARHRGVLATGPGPSGPAYHVPARRGQCVLPSGEHAGDHGGAGRRQWAGFLSPHGDSRLRRYGLPHREGRRPRRLPADPRAPGAADLLVEPRPNRLCYRRVRTCWRGTECTRRAAGRRVPRGRGSGSNTSRNAPRGPPRDAIPTRPCASTGRS